MNAPRLNLRPPIPNRPVLPPKSGAVGIVIRRWRALSGGGRVRDPDRRTLIACSAGADSSALALCLAAAGSNLVVAHILHDLRPALEATADLEAARSLASRLSLQFASASVSCKSKGGNLEAVARRERYAALVALAREHACPFIATAHHADDQLETLLMRLIRGSGPRGLSGIAPKRRLAPGITLIRPMLDITRIDAEAICRDAGVSWTTDATNTDRTRLRAALRHDVVPALRSIAPSIATTAGRVAAVQREIAHELEREANVLLATAEVQEHRMVRFRRRDLAGAPRTVAELALRRAVERVGCQSDAPSALVMTRAISRLRARSGERRLYEFAGASILIEADGATVFAPPTRRES
ncbi:MAG: tRNA lysidine(34) synthetase TilS [Phycisphaerales bacterium]|nr:tRNA lysidine(34) synthetase TilS [Phycisphaerales bacterium]